MQPITGAERRCFATAQISLLLLLDPSCGAGIALLPCNIPAAWAPKVYIAWPGALSAWVIALGRDIASIEAGLPLAVRDWWSDEMGSGTSEVWCLP